MTHHAYFDTLFQQLTGNPPFPWQRALFEEFVAGKFPSSCNLPTGLGKTAVIPIWLIALAYAPVGKVPRRLVYVVNRRTVVDQSTREAEKLREKLIERKTADVQDLANRLRQLSALASQDEEADVLAISTLRGQFADNREWSADPSRPAVIVGTVDMIGSRLLFSGYGVGFKAKPLHAGFLAQDSLLIHDEAHLEPAFQELLIAIEREQKRCNEFGKFTVIELSATTRGVGTSFPDDEQQKANEADPVVKKRVGAKKTIRLHELQDAKKLPEKICEFALQHKESGKAVLIFVRRVDDVQKIVDKLPANATAQLTGTLRGWERDRLVKTAVFQRFLPLGNRAEGVTPQDGTVYLVCTSAGEVGVNISADHLVCDLSTFDSMAQRFGRVNRFGECEGTIIDIVHPRETDLDDVDPVESRLKKTLKLLQELNGDGSPRALASLNPNTRVEAFAPPPTILPVTDILFDAWALTSIRASMPGRPPVEPYLHGITEWQPPETYIAWREEVRLTDKLLPRYELADLLDDFPLWPHELLRDSTDRKSSGVFAELAKIAQRCPTAIVWIVDQQGGVRNAKLQDVVKGDSRRLYGATVLLPPDVGGLTPLGTFEGDAPRSPELNYDISDVVTDDKDRRRRFRAWNDEDVPGYLRPIRTIELEPDGDGDESDEANVWTWYELPREGGRSSTREVTWQDHVDGVVDHATRMVAALSLPREFGDAVVFAARLHDHGKKRERFQITLGNREFPTKLLAKSGRKGARLPEPFRHEFASVFDSLAEPEFAKLSPDMQDFVLHVIAAHHGRARPHFDSDEAFDPERAATDADALAAETPRRFARLQRKYGRWGLAYLESLLRAADWAASADEAKS